MSSCFIFIKFLFNFSVVRPIKNLEANYNTSVHKTAQLRRDPKTKNDYEP